MKKRIGIFLLGVLCFMTSQPLIRLPLLNYLQGTTEFMLLYTLYPIGIGIIIAFSAGLFEESFRFLIKKFLIKPVKTTILEPIIFGLGHGLAEAGYILLPAFSLVSLADLRLAIIERVLAIILHVGLTVTVWNGFQKNQRLKYLSLAILIHGLINALIPVLSSSKNFIGLILGSLVLIDFMMIVYIYHSRKFYLTEEIQ